MRHDFGCAFVRFRQNLMKTLGATYEPIESMS